MDANGRKEAGDIGQNLKKLGFRDGDIPAIESIIRSGNGLFVAAGGASSGMSTTVMSILPRLPKEKKIGFVAEPAELTPEEARNLVFR